MVDRKTQPLLLAENTQDEGTFTKIFRKVKQDPAVFVGMTGWAGLVGYGLYNIKKRKTPLPLYLIHLRVTAQVFAIGSMVSVVGYRIYKHEMKKYQKDETDV